MVTPSHDQDTPIVAEKRTPLEEALVNLDPEWIVLADLEIGTPPRAITADYVLLHSGLGIALIDISPGHTPDPVEAFRRFLEDERFAAFFPGFLPIVRLVVPADDKAIAERLRAAFASLPLLSIADPEWAEAINSLLIAPDAAQIPAPAAPPIMPDHDEPVEPGFLREERPPIEELSSPQARPEQDGEQEAGREWIAADPADRIAALHEPEHLRDREAPRLRGPLPPEAPFGLDQARPRRWPAVAVALAALIGGGAAWLAMSASDSDDQMARHMAVVPMPPPIDATKSAQVQLQPTGDGAPQPAGSDAAGTGGSSGVATPAATSTLDAPSEPPSIPPLPAPPVPPAPPAVKPVIAQTAPPVAAPLPDEAPPAGPQPSSPAPLAGSTVTAPDHLADVAPAQPPAVPSGPPADTATAKPVLTAKLPPPQDTPAPSPPAPVPPAPIPPAPAAASPAQNSPGQNSPAQNPPAPNLSAQPPAPQGPAQSAAPSGTTASTPPPAPAKAHPKPVKTARNPAPSHPVPMARTGPPIDAADLPPLDAGDLPPPPPAPNLPPAPAWIGPPTPTWIAPPTQNSVRRPLSLLQRSPPVDGNVTGGSAAAANATRDNAASAMGTSETGTGGNGAAGSPPSGSSSDISVSALPPLPPSAAPAAPAKTGTQTAAAVEGSSTTDKQVCRIYSATKVYQGREQPVTGLACRTRDGRWEPITEGPAP